MYRAEIIKSALPDIWIHSRISLSCNFDRYCFVVILNQIITALRCDDIILMRSLLVGIVEMLLKSACLKAELSNSFVNDFLVWKSPLVEITFAAFSSFEVATTYHTVLIFVSCIFSVFFCCSSTLCCSAIFLL